MGLFYQQSEIQSDNSAMLFIFIFILLLNIYFILKWGFMFLDVLLRTYFDRLKDQKLFKFLKEREIDNYDQNLRKVLE